MKQEGLNKNKCMLELEDQLPVPMKRVLDVTGLVM